MNGRTWKHVLTGHLNSSLPPRRYLWTEQLSELLLYIFDLKDHLGVISPAHDQNKRMKAVTRAPQGDFRFAEIGGNQALSSTCIVRIHTKPSPLATAPHGCQRLLQEDGEEEGLWGRLQGSLPGHLKLWKALKGSQLHGAERPSKCAAGSKWGPRFPEHLPAWFSAVRYLRSIKTEMQPLGIGC